MNLFDNELVPKKEEISVTYEREKMIKTNKKKRKNPYILVYIKEYIKENIY